MLVLIVCGIISLAMGVAAFLIQRHTFATINGLSAQMPLETLGAKPLPIQWKIMCLLSLMSLVAGALWTVDLRWGITALDILAYPVSFLFNILVLLIVHALWFRKAPVTDIVRRYTKLAKIWFFLVWLGVFFQIILWISMIAQY